MTPSGIEAGPNVTETRRTTGASTKAAAGERPAAVARCNECNEALDAARLTMAAARRLALVADNALVNGDLAQTRRALREILDATVPVAATAPAAQVPVKT